MTNVVRVVLVLCVGFSLLGCDEPRVVRRDAGPATRDAGTPDANDVVWPDAAMGADVGVGPGTDADVLLPDAPVLIVDAYLLPDAYVPPDAYVSPDAYAAPDAYVTPVPTTFNFPASDDTFVRLAGTAFWNAGDYAQATRSTSLGSARELSMSLGITANFLSCDTQDVRVTLNGVAVGTFSIGAGASNVTQTFSFSPIAGPNYTVRYETTRTVAGGCGSAAYDTAVSTVTLR